MCRQETFKITFEYSNRYCRVPKVIWEAVAEGWASYTKTSSGLSRQFNQWDSKLVTVSGSESETR